jgi:hypothetical protein
MMLDVQLGCLGGMVGGVMRVAVSGVSVMSGGLMIAFFVVPCGLSVMPGGVLVMFGCFVMMLCGVLGHAVLLRIGPGGTA